MKHRKKESLYKIFFISMGLAVISGIVGYIYVHGYRCDRLSCIRLLDKQDWKLVDVFEEERGSVFRALYKHTSTPEYFLRVDARDDIDSDTATDYIKGKIAGMNALYENIRSPYPGLLSNEIQCDEPLKPTYETMTSDSGVPIQIIHGYLNDRMTFGSCLASDVEYRGSMALFGCGKKKQLYQVEFIAHQNGFSQQKVMSWITSIACS